MSSSLHPNHLLQDGLGVFHVQYQQCNRGLKVGPLIEMLGEVAQLADEILAVTARLEATGKGGFQISQNLVHPTELRQVPALGCTGNLRLVHATCGVSSSNAAHASTGDHIGSCGMRSGPRNDGLEHEAGHLGPFHAELITQVVVRDRRDGGIVVLRSSTELAAKAFVAKVGSVDLHETTQAVCVVSLDNRREDPMVHQPRRGITHTETAFEYQGRQSCPGFADEIDRQEPRDKQHPSAGVKSTSRVRSLIAKGLALEQLLRTVAKGVVDGLALARAAEVNHPASSLAGLLVLFRGAKAAQQLWLGYTVLPPKAFTGIG